MRAFLMLTGWGFSVMPLLMVFYVIGWIWCCAVDGFALARMSYEKYRASFDEL